MSTFPATSVFFNEPETLGAMMHLFTLSKELVSWIRNDHGNDGSLGYAIEISLSVRMGLWFTRGSVIYVNGPRERG